MAKQVFTKITTPKGVAVFPHLHAPDTKFKAEGRYGTKIRLSPEDAQPLVEAIERELPKAQELLDEAKAKAPKNKQGEFALEREPWAEEDNGDLTFSFGMNAKVTSKKDGKVYDLRPQLLDAKGGKIKAGTKIGSGSIIRVAGELFPYFNAATKKAGISLRLVAVQVIDLKQFGERSAEDLGFGIEEDGFSADELENEESQDSTDEGADEGEGTYQKGDF